MSFSNKQLSALRRNLDHRNVRTRSDNGRELSYIEGWHAIAEANRIFGFDGWNRETVESRTVLARELRGTYTAVYVAKVRITVRANGTVIVREGHGTGQARGSTPGEVHDTALKAAETDGTKRALATFGRPFGLALYLSARPSSGPTKPPLLDLDGARRFAERAPPPQARPAALAQPAEEAPIPEPVRAASGPGVVSAPESPDASIIPDNAATLPHPDPCQRGIDKSLLPLGEPKRYRDRDHLKFVTTQPCLICSRAPSDAHHLRFAQPRAAGRKVSDEYTVPLCRLHHRQLHDAGNEVTWWMDMDIDPIPIAQTLWEETRAKRFANDNTPSAAAHEAERRS